MNNFLGPNYYEFWSLLNVYPKFQILSCPRKEKLLYLSSLARLCEWHIQCVWEDNRSLQLLNNWWSSIFFCPFIKQEWPLGKIWNGGVTHMPFEKQFYKMFPVHQEVNESVLSFCCLGYSATKDNQKWKLGKEVGE